MTIDTHPGSGPRRGVQSSKPSPNRNRKWRLEGAAGTAALSATGDSSATTDPLPLPPGPARRLRSRRNLADDSLRSSPP